MSARLKFSGAAFLRTVVGLCLAAALFALPAAADPSQQYVSAEPAAVSLRPGSSANLTLSFRVADGFHINSNKPNSDLLIPTQLTIEPAAGFRVLGMKYAAGHELRLSFDPSEPLNVYSGAFSVQTQLAAAAHQAAGSYTLQGVLRYQACSDSACYPPKSLPVSVQVTVGSGH
jgi:hypothetical protein